jgi:hypothetical protein
VNRRDNIVKWMIALYSWKRSWTLVQMR